MLKEKIEITHGFDYDDERHGKIVNVYQPASNALAAFAEGEIASSMMHHYIAEHGTSYPSLIITTTKGTVFCTDDCHEESYKQLREM